MINQLSLMRKPPGVLMMRCGIRKLRYLTLKERKRKPLFGSMVRRSLNLWEGSSLNLW